MSANRHGTSSSSANAGSGTRSVTPGPWHSAASTMPWPGCTCCSRSIDKPSKARWSRAPGRAPWTPGESRPAWTICACWQSAWLGSLVCARTCAARATSNEGCARCRNGACRPWKISVSAVGRRWPCCNGDCRQPWPTTTGCFAGNGPVAPALGLEMPMTLHSATEPAVAPLIQARRFKGSAGLPDPRDVHLAWRREMERLQVASWFPGAPSTLDTRPADGSAAGRRPADRDPQHRPALASLDAHDGEGRLRPSESLASTPVQALVTPDTGADGEPGAPWSSAVPAAVHGASGVASAYPTVAPGSGAVDPCEARRVLQGRAASAPADADAPPGAAPRPAAATSVHGVPPVNATGPLPAAATDPSPRTGPSISAVDPVARPGTAASVWLDPCARPLPAPAVPVASVAPAPPLTSRPAKNEEAVLPGLRGTAELQKLVAHALARDSGPRLHVQWDGTAAHVWLGVDAMPDAAELLQTLQRVLRRSGLELHTLVCNGRPLVTTRVVPPVAAAHFQQES